MNIKTANYRRNVLIDLEDPLACSVELAVDDADNQQHQDCDDRNGYKPIRSHPVVIR